MTYPPYGGPDQPPSGPPQQDPWQQPAPPPYGPQPAPPPYGQQPAPPPYGQPTPEPSWPGQPAPGQQYSVDPYPAQPGFPPPGQPSYPPYGAPAPKKRRGLLIVSLVLAIALVLCGGGSVGAYLLLRNTETGEGAAEPVAAVEDFLEAVYRDKDADRAAGLVCSAARDKEAIRKKIAEVEGYEGKYDKPRFRWDKPKIDDENKERAIVSVELTMITGDEKTAEQDLVFTVVQQTGWWVCEVG